MLKKILAVFLLVFIGIQFIRPAKNMTSRPQPDDLFAHQPAPEDIRRLIEHGCYDCHSNHTRYPWYAQVQPIGWWLARHIDEGKEHLNFSEFARLTPKRAARRLEQSAELIEDGSMPLPSYTWVHRDALLSAEQKKRIIDWLDGLQERIQPSDTSDEK